MHWHGQVDVTSDSSPLSDHLVELIDNADITVCTLRKSNGH